MLKEPNRKLLRSQLSSLLERPLQHSPSMFGRQRSVRHTRAQVAGCRVLPVLLPLMQSRWMKERERARERERELSVADSRHDGGM